MNARLLSILAVVFVFGMSIPKAATAAPELCNYQDDDGDGKIDEDFPIGIPCHTGLGECRTEGVWSCALLLPDTAMCNATGIKPQPQPEICDGLDNDCNGIVDDLTLNTGTCFVPGESGGCVEGRLMCEVGTSHAVCVSFGKRTEICENGIDEDCDGYDQVCDGSDGGADLGEPCRPVYIENNGCSLSSSPTPSLPTFGFVALGLAGLLTARRSRRAR